MRTGHVPRLRPTPGDDGEMSQLRAREGLAESWMEGSAEKLVRFSSQAQTYEERMREAEEQEREASAS